jgi:transketolase
MALEDLAMMRAVLGTTVLYPSDGVSAERLTELAMHTPGMVYIRTSRPKTPALYTEADTFEVGGSKTLRRSAADRATLVAAGVTVHSALAAQSALAQAGLAVRVIDAYSIKPLDAATMLQAAQETGLLVTVEDHSAWGGLGDAVAAAVAGKAPVECLAVREVPRSGKPEELMQAYGISADRIVERLRGLLG